MRASSVKKGRAASAAFDAPSSAGSSHSLTVVFSKACANLSLLKELECPAPRREGSGAVSRFAMFTLFVSFFAPTGACARDLALAQAESLLVSNNREL